MSEYKLSNRSRRRMRGLHPDLIDVVEMAIHLTEVDFTVLEGMRTPARQKELFDIGATTTLNSRHLTGHAVDLGAYVAGSIRWDWPLYYKIADAMKKAAGMLHVDLEWGGDWTTFKDGPHFQLSWDKYPNI